jgi:hypothetical protein
MVSMGGWGGVGDRVEDNCEVVMVMSSNGKSNNTFNPHNIPHKTKHTYHSQTPQHNNVIHNPSHFQFSR